MGARWKHQPHSKPSRPLLHAAAERERELRAQRDVIRRVLRGEKLQLRMGFRAYRAAAAAAEAAGTTLAEVGGLAGCWQLAVACPAGCPEGKPSKEHLNGPL